MVRLYAFAALLCLLVPRSTAFGQSPSGCSLYPAAKHASARSAAPTSEVLVAPAHGDTVAVPVYLYWRRWDATGQVHYLLQIDDEASFETPLEYVGFSDSDTSYTATGGLQPGQTYYWRVGVPYLVMKWSEVCSFYVSDVAAPALTAPDHQAVDQPPTLDLSWQPVEGSGPGGELNVLYRVQLGTTSTFAAPLVDALQSDTTYAAGPLSFRTAYYWRVRFEGNGYGGGTQRSGWAGPRRFTTMHPPVPNPVAPRNDSSGILLADLALVWEGADGASAYQVEVALDTAFSQLALPRRQLLENTWDDLDGLQPGTTHHWHVRAVYAADTSAWSTPWRFTTLPLPGPADPVSPIDDADPVPAKPLFTWWQAPDAFTYRLEVAAGSVFDENNVVASFEGVTADSLRPHAALGYGQSFSWRVRGENPNGVGPWSPSRRLTTADEQPLGPPLRLPGDGDLRVPVRPHLAWHAYEGAYSYRYQLATDASFDPEAIVHDRVVEEVQGGPPPAHGATPLLDGFRWHYWRVRASTRLDDTQWSDVHRFRTLPSAPFPLADAAAQPLPAPLPLEVHWDVRPSAEEQDRYGGDYTYYLEVRTGPDYSIRVDSMELTSTRVTLDEGDGLQAGTIYEYKFRAQTRVNEAGTHFESDWGSVNLDVEFYDRAHLALPEDGATSIGLDNLWLYWHPVDSPSGSLNEQPWNYDIQVWHLEEADTVYVVLETTPQNPEPGLVVTDTLFRVNALLEPDAEHFWRVRPRNPLGPHLWSETWTFRTGSGQPPDQVPVQASPTPGETVGPTPTFVWEGVAPAVAYQVWVKRGIYNAIFVTLPATPHSWTTPASLALEPGRTYQWYVRACWTSLCGVPDVSYWAGPSDLTVDLPALAAPTPQHPLPQHQVSAPTAVLTWTAVAEADAYQVQLDTTAFTAPLLDRVVTGTSQSVADLREGTAYNWRVRARRSVGGTLQYSPWAETYFTTAGAPPGPLPVPADRQPAEGATNVPSPPTFTWSAVPGAVYDLHLAGNDAFDPMLWGVRVQGTSYTLTEAVEFTPGGTYYWRLRACAATSPPDACHDDSGWTAAWPFTVGSGGPPPVPQLLSPADSAYVGAGGAVDLAWQDVGAAGYTVEWQAEGAASQQVAGISAATHRLTGMAGQTWHAWRVKACAASGACSGWSAERWFFTGSAAAARYYYMTDHLGSVRATVEENGTVVHFDDYYPFGAPMPGRNYVAGEEGAPAGKPRYTGHEQEVEIDPGEKAVYYAGARYYDAVIGLWSSLDPMAEKYPGWSPYNYVLGNPVKLFDPNGAAPVCPRCDIMQDHRVYAGLGMQKPRPDPVVAAKTIDFTLRTFVEPYDWARIGLDWLTGNGSGWDVLAAAPFFSGATDDVIGLLPRFSRSTVSDAQGLVGRDFEGFLVENLGGRGSFKVGGREFDVAVGNRWIEAKSGGFWELALGDSQVLDKFKSTIAQQQKIASENNATFEVISNVPIPQEVKEWLTRKGIGFTEIIE